MDRRFDWTLSRRTFAAVPVMLAGVAAALFAPRGALTAGQVVERIKQHLGVPWREGPADACKAGDANGPVFGIAITVMSTFDVLRKAAAARRNMVVTHEPTCSTGTDDVKNFADDALYQRWRP